MASLFALRKLLSFLFLFLLFFAPVRAVSPSGGNGISTSSWDVNVTGWDFVGSIGTASGIYLGNYNGSYWVATAAHVGAGTLSLGGYSYDYLPGSVVTMNPTETYTPDLVLIQISASDSGALDYLDSLGNLAFDTTGIAAGTNVRLVGNGGGKSWGDNTLAGTMEYTIDGTPYGGMGYYTLDDDGVAVIVGDSGGGMFYRDGDGTWVLAGILSAKGEPGDSIIGAFAISLAEYSDQILAAVPEPSVWAAILGGAALATACWSRRKRR